MIVNPQKIEKKQFRIIEPRTTRGWDQYLKVVCILLIVRVVMIWGEITFIDLPYIDAWIRQLLAWAEASQR